MKALKIFARIFFTIFFIVLIFCIAVVLSYTLNQPERTGDSRSIISGPWVDKKDGEMEFVFGQDGKFTIKDDGAVLADGYFKIDEKAGKIKLLMLPGHYNDKFSKFVKYKCLAEIAYGQLECNIEDDQINEEDPPEVTLLLRSGDGTGDSESYECKMNEYTLDLYNSEHNLAKDA